jgi:acyl-CoA dehydrogenase
VWEFQTDADFQLELDWISAFVAEEIEPLDYLLGSQWNIHEPNFVKLVRPLQAKVKTRGLWACHLGPELGGKGYGQVKLALMNEQFGRSRFGPIVFGAQAPDTGNAEILAHYGTEEQKERYLRPLLNNDIVSCFAMTEPQGGSDPTSFTCSAVEKDGSWVVNGEKWFASNARFASFFIVMVVTEPESADPHGRMSMLIIPAETPGIEIVKDYTYYGQAEPEHGHLRFTDARVPRDSLLGSRGEAFVVAQVRLGGGRLHHAMRALAEATKCLDLTCERVSSRFTKGERLSQKQMVQERLADCWIQLRQFRLLIMETAWLADKSKDWKAVRRHIAAVKVTMPKVLHDVAATALHLHGSLGLSTEMPFAYHLMNSYMIGLADGPTEVHKMTVAKEMLRGVAPSDGPFPSYLRTEAERRARQKYADLLE